MSIFPIAGSLLFVIVALGGWGIGEWIDKRRRDPREALYGPPVLEDTPEVLEWLERRA